MIEPDCNLVKICGMAAVGPIPGLGYIQDSHKAGTDTVGPFHCAGQSNEIFQPSLSGTKIPAIRYR